MILSIIGFLISAYLCFIALVCFGGLCATIAEKFTEPRRKAKAEAAAKATQARRDRGEVSDAELLADYARRHFPPQQRALRWDKRPRNLRQPSA